MKKFLLPLLVFFTCLTELKAGEISAFYSYASFNTPAGKPFLETYITIAGNSVQFIKQKNGKFQGKVEISIALFRQDTAYVPKKYFLLSPEISDTANRPSFIDVQRLPVDKGTYAIEISLGDAFSPSKKKLTLTEKIEIDFPENTCSLSDIQLIESRKKSVDQGVLNKSGFEIIPYPAGIYSDENSTLNFYAEAYSASKVFGENEKFAFFYFIENLETQERSESFAGFQKQNAALANVIFGQLDVSKLKSGNYLLNLEVRDKLNAKICSKKIPFIRKTSSLKSPLSELSEIGRAHV